MKLKSDPKGCTFYLHLTPMKDICLANLLINNNFNHRSFKNSYFCIFLNPNPHILLKESFHLDTLFANSIIFIFRALRLPYFFGYKTEFLAFQNYPKNLDPSCKTDLDLLDCSGRVTFHRTDFMLVICCHFGERKTSSYSRINKQSSR